MKRLHRILSGLPILIILVWVFCLMFMVDNSAYKLLYYRINIADTILTTIALLHAMFNWYEYSKISKYCVRAIIAISLLQLLDGIINQSFYYYLYFFIIVTTIFESIRVNLRKNE